MIAVEADVVNVAVFLSDAAVERDDFDDFAAFEIYDTTFAPPEITLPPKSVTPASTIHNRPLSSTRMALTLTKRWPTGIFESVLFLRSFGKGCGWSSWSSFYTDGPSERSI